MPGQGGPGAQPAANLNYPAQAFTQPGYGGAYGTQSTLPSYAPPPPPMNDIEQAKQRAQEIATRILNNATKRVRVENVGNGDRGFDLSDCSKHLTFGSWRMGGQSSGTEHFEMKIPNNKVGLVIGKGGETIKRMQAETGARIQVIPLWLPPGDTSRERERTVRIEGTIDQIEAAKQSVIEVISEAHSFNLTRIQTGISHIKLED